ncbi:MAG: phage tail sheath C-terminal domain-containing protein [bacterium]
MYANSDSLGELWFAPAGLNRAILTGVRRLAWNPDKGSRDLLYPAQINSIVSFTGQGKVIWGNRTLLDKGSSFQSINVRRLFIHLRKNILKASKYYIFEQIDDITFAQLRNTIEPFLKTVKGRRGIEEYKIVLDETLNTPETRARNEV